MDREGVNEEVCHRCGERVGAGSPLYTDRATLDDGRLVCRECALALRGRETPVIERPDVSISMPNSNLPNTH